MKAGTVVTEFVESRALRGNPMGDPATRRVPVYLPPGYHRSGARYPAVYVLTGFTGSGEMFLNRSAWSEPLPERLDRLIGRGKIPPMIAVMPDCFTALGGSQYLNSSATGRYEDHVVRELVAWIDGRYRTVPKAPARAVMGKSSGGYGALVLGMRHPDVFGLVACHSGDMYFDYCYLPDFPRALNAIRARGGAAAWLAWWRRQPKRTDSAHMSALNTLAMASCYSPNPRARLGFDLPFDERTGELREEVWRRWLAWDPVRMLPKHAANLRRLRLLYVDCGTRDEFNLHWGMRVFASRAKALGVKCVVEEFDDGHMNIAYRYDASLAAIGARLRV
jgi:enterochelin esterase family protein